MILPPTVPTEDQPTASSRVTLHPPAVARGNKTRPTARPRTQQPTNQQQALFGAESEVTVILFLSHDSEVMQLLYQRVFTTSRTGQSVSEVGILNELSLIESGLSVTTETLQTDHMTLGAREHHHHISDVDTGDTLDPSRVSSDQIQSHRALISGRGVGRTLEEKLRFTPGAPV